MDGFIVHVDVELIRFASAPETLWIGRSAVILVIMTQQRRLETARVRAYAGATRRVRPKGVVRVGAVPVGVLSGARAEVCPLDEASSRGRREVTEHRRHCG